MNKLLTTGVAALTLCGSVIAAAAPAEAQTRGNHGGYHGGGYQGGGNHGGSYRGGYGYRRDNDAGLAIGAGIAGLALGAALNSGPHYYNHGYYNRGYYDGGYYRGGYYDDGGYETCVSHRTIWDPYIHRYVVRRVEYAC